MLDFKFVCRKDELDFVQNALLEKKYIIYYYLDNSGLTHYLKKLSIILNAENDICFYVDCNKNQGVATQIATQIIACSDKNAMRKYTQSNSKKVKKVLETLTTSIDIIPFVNVGELISGFTSAIKNTLDTDIEHLSDYKIEKAILNMFKQISQKARIKNIYILIDDASSLKPESLDFIAKLMTFDIVKFLITIPNNQISSAVENLSKVSVNEFDTYTIDKKFDRPDDKMIKGLFECYNQTYNDEYLNVFKRYERNIHIIMSFVRGFHMNFMQLDSDSICILKIMLILNTTIELFTLEAIYNKTRHMPVTIQHADFQTLINKMREQGFIEVDANDLVHLNHNIISEQELKITLIERLTISRDIVDTFETCKNRLTIPQLKFAINNLDKDYSRRKTYILFLLDKQKGLGQVEQQYLDMLFFLDNKYDLLNICSMYYDLQVYDVPYFRLLQHTDFLEERECKDLLALIQERLHKDDYCEKLWDLIYTSKNIDEKCLLLAVLFTALFNNGESDECLKILNDPKYEFYYKKLCKSKYYHFLLRNVSYYIENIDEGIDNYKSCLFKFKNCDPVNYNRTLTNFLGYLIKQKTNKKAQTILKEKISEAQSILEFNDQKYLYLNINYGIYLMLETDDDPTPYFESILLDKGTTETPYIYARINHALYIAKSNPKEAIKHLDEIYFSLICESNVVPTKIFYKINRLLVEYMDDKNNMSLLEEVKSAPLRGDKKFTDELYSFYTYRFNNKIKYQPSDWKRCFLPGCIFYHGFEADLLMSSLARPSSRI